MLDETVAVTLVPQSFHNVLLPDAFDFANANFMCAPSGCQWCVCVCSISP